MKFSDGSRNNYTRGPSQLLTPLYSQTDSSHLCWHERAGWARQNWLCPRAQDTLDTKLLLVNVIFPSELCHKSRKPCFQFKILLRNGATCISRLNLQWYHILIILLLTASLHTYQS